MGFDTLLGNERLKDNLSSSLQKGRISHFYLISGPAGSGKRTLARLLSAAILCREGQSPCLRCGICRRVQEGNHPDVITVEDPEHKNVPVKLVRQYRDDAFIRPNESDHKIYLFPQDLGLEGQNALLKLLEEPPPYGVFILLTENPEKLLPTVRSRCTELKMQALPRNVLLEQLAKDFPKADREELQAAAERSGGFLGQARQMLADGSETLPQTESFVCAMAQKDALELTVTLVSMEKWKREALIDALDSWIAITEGALASRVGGATVYALSRNLAAARTSPELLDALLHLKKAREYALSNVSPAAICGYLQWQLRS